MLQEHLEGAELLGEGGFATVWLAFCASTGRPVALKILHPHVFGNNQARERFLREAKSLAQIDHESIVKVYRYGLSGETPFLVMEYVKGRTLNDLRSDSPLPLPDSLAIFGKVVRAVGAMHQQGFVHRDLNPRNCMVIEDTGDVKIIDFGLVRATACDEYQKLTLTGQVVGTPAYLSPEGCWGRQQDERSDVYSLGCVLYFLLTGQPPFAAGKMEELLMKQAFGEYAPLAKVMNDGSSYPNLEMLVEKCLKKNPSERYQTTCQLENALSNPHLLLSDKSKKRFASSVAYSSICLFLLLLLGGYALTSNFRFGKTDQISMKNLTQTKSHDALANLPFDRRLELVRRYASNVPNKAWEKEHVTAKYKELLQTSTGSQSVIVLNNMYDLCRSLSKQYGRRPEIRSEVAILNQWAITREIESKKAHSAFELYKVFSRENQDDSDSSGKHDNLVRQSNLISEIVDLVAISSDKEVLQEKGDVYEELEKCFRLSLSNSEPTAVAPCAYRLALVESDKRKLAKHLHEASSFIEKSRSSPVETYYFLALAQEAAGDEQEALRWATLVIESNEKRVHPPLLDCCHLFLRLAASHVKAVKIIHLERVASLLGQLPVTDRVQLEYFLTVVFARLSNAAIEEISESQVPFRPPPNSYSYENLRERSAQWAKITLQDDSKVNKLTVLQRLDMWEYIPSPPNSKLDKEPALRSLSAVITNLQPRERLVSLVRLAHLYEGLGVHSEAFRWAEVAIQENDKLKLLGTLDQCVALVVLSRQEQRYVPRLAETARVLPKDMRKTEIRWELWECYLKFGESSKAVRLAKELLQDGKDLSPCDRIELLTKLIEDSRVSSKKLGYLQQMEAVVQEVPPGKHRAETRYRLWECYLKFGESSKAAVRLAKELLQDGKDLSPCQRIELLTKLIEDSRVSSKKLEYLQQMEAVVQELPPGKHRAETRYRLWECYLKFGKSSKAAVRLAKELLQDGKDLDARVRIDLLTRLIEDSVSSKKLEYLQQMGTEALELPVGKPRLLGEARAAAGYISAGNRKQALMWADRAIWDNKIVNAGNPDEFFRTLLDIKWQVARDTSDQLAALTEANQLLTNVSVSKRAKIRTSCLVPSYFALGYKDLALEHALISEKEDAEYPQLTTEERLKLWSLALESCRTDAEKTAFAEKLAKNLELAPAKHRAAIELSIASTYIKKGDKKRTDQWLNKAIEDERSFPQLSTDSQQEILRLSALLKQKS